jgi:hypothetical protein
MEIKVVCECGQKYAFDVEPRNESMPAPVSCPVCGKDGTGFANQQIRQKLAASGPATVAVSSSAAVAGHTPGYLRINRSSHTAESSPAPAAVPPPLPSRPKMGISSTAPAMAAQATNNLGLGILGAIIGAAVGAGLMYGFFLLTEFKFPLFGVGIGALTGLGARLGYRGTDSTLGGIAAAIALATVTGTLYLMFGEISIINVISMVVSVSMAFKIAA